MNDWSLLGYIALSCILSAGGIGGIVVGIIKFSSNAIAERLSQKYQLKLDEALEKYKTELNKKEYVSKSRFDAEFRMYQELSEKTISAVYCTGEAVMVVRGAPYTENEIGNFIERFCETLNDASRANRRYASFITAEMYDKYFSIEQKAGEIFDLLKAWKQFRAGERFNIKVRDSYYGNQAETAQAIEKKRAVLSNELDALIVDLRGYLDKLDVLEEA